MCNQAQPQVQKEEKDETICEPIQQQPQEQHCMEEQLYVQQELKLKC
jgi:hypothetical protein